MTDDRDAEAIAKAEAELVALECARDEASARLAALRKSRSLAPRQITLPIVGDLPPTPISNAAEKIHLFRSVFRGRTDVFPKRWENRKTEKAGYAPACANEWVRGICEKPRVKCGECPQQAFVAFDDRTIADHLSGKITAGVYPLLADDTCWFVAADFDEESWQDDVAAFAEIARRHDLAPAVERSRSGKGAHVWFFFEHPVKAVDARNMASFLLTETIRLRRELNLRSYDRLFPSQDALPAGGFGNLIALPFQFGPRKQGNSLFLDEGFEPFSWPEQWRFLSTIRRLTRERVEEVAKEAVRTQRVLAVAALSDDLSDNAQAPWKPAKTEKSLTARLPFAIPTKVGATLAGRLFINKDGLPAGLLSRFRRLTAFQNPEFYKRQRLRLSTGLTPRVIVCAEDLPQHLAVPRGCLDEVRGLLDANDSCLDLDDQREGGGDLAVEFRGVLTDVQKGAVEKLVGHDCGVLVAPPGSGKTVMGAYLIAARRVPTLVLVHRGPLLDQWINQLCLFLGLDRGDIGQIGAGRSRLTGKLDVAMIQSLIREGEVRGDLAGYAHIIVDECHHVPAVSFERLIGAIPARYVTGLTATPRRRDGHHPIAAMQLGPVRHTIDAKAQAAARPFGHKYFVRETGFTIETAGDVPIQKIYRALAADMDRNQMIARDVGVAIEQGRNPIVITERKDHLAVLADLIRGVAPSVDVLHGGMTAASKRVSAGRATGKNQVVVAIGRYVGEGYDDPRLDTLFLTMPLSWTGTLIQYTGRIQRLHPGKREVRIHDYVDRQVPVLDRMFRRRLVGYRSLGYAEGELPLGYGDADDDYVLGRGWEEEDEEGHVNDERTGPIR